MNSQTPAETLITVQHEDRYHRQRLIPWWDQDRVRQARALVIGAGALGNEVLKTLALTGVGNILVYDMDIIEQSNLSRSVLFREEDRNHYKAKKAAERIVELNPEVSVVGRAENILERLGIGVFQWADMVICGLDNRIARLFVNRACAWVGRVWVDGAIEGLGGIVRVFDPARTSCYECTMNDVDRQQVNERMSCAMLARNAVSSGYVPNTAVMATIVGALEVQEAIKYLHNQPTLMGEGLHINGLWEDFSRVAYPRRSDCAGHVHYESILPLGFGVADTTLGELLDRAERELGEDAVLDLSRDVIVRWECLACGKNEHCGKVLGVVGEQEAKCPHCGEHRAVIFTSTITRHDDIDLTLTPAQLGIPPLDCLVARKGFDRVQCWVFDGDAKHVLQTLDLGCYQATSE